MKLQSKSGFTFVELCIVMMVIGILIAGVLAGYMVYAQKQRYEITRERSHALQYALQSYIEANDRLPCPADPNIANLTAGAGKEVACLNGAAPTGGILKSGTGANEIWSGAVPTATLRLGNDGGVDGWGNRFTYVVSHKLTQQGGLTKVDKLVNGVTVKIRPYGVIEVVDVDNNAILSADEKARFLVLSSGPTGKGAWTQQGVRRACPASSVKEAENCNNDEKFVMAALTRKEGSGFYDDVLIHDESVQANPDLGDRILYCNSRKMFFAPTDRTGTVDEHGCVSNGDTTEIVQTVLTEINTKIATCAASGKEYNKNDASADANGCAWPAGQLLGLCTASIGTTTTLLNPMGYGAYYPMSVSMTTNHRGYRYFEASTNCQCAAGLTRVTVSSDTVPYNNGGEGSSGVNQSLYYSCMRPIPGLNTKIIYTPGLSPRPTGVSNF